MIDGKFVEGDVVDWTVTSGGGRGRVLGIVRCRVIYSGIEVGLWPLVWDEARDVLLGDLADEDVDDLKRRGVIDNCKPEDCELVEHAPDLFPLGSRVYVPRDGKIAEGTVVDVNGSSVTVDVEGDTGCDCEAVTFDRDEIKSAS